MKKYFHKYETLITISLIIIYLISNSICINNFGITSYKTTIVNLILSILIIIFIIKNNLTSYYGLNSFPNPKKYLYFIPLIILILLNFINGININNTKDEIMFYILSMFLIGFLEEIIFRGFLFKMMSKDNIKSAIIITSITFGIGHIINIFNGEDLIPTLIQVIYAMSAGYLFVIIFYKGKSLWPCIICHSLVNASSIFNIDNYLSLYISPIILVIISISYSIYINKKIKD